MVQSWESEVALDRTVEVWMALEQRGDGTYLNTLNVSPERDLLRLESDCCRHGAALFCVGVTDILNYLSF
jgi:hypothetical protein